MGSFQENISHAIEIYRLFRKTERTDGCVETATVALGGDFDKIYSLAKLKIEDRLGGQIVNERILDIAGLKVRRSYPVAVASAQKIAVFVESDLEKDDVNGVMVISHIGVIGHASALIHRRNYPTSIRGDQHVIVDTSTREPLRFGSTISLLSARTGYTPEKVLIVTRK